AGEAVIEVPLALAMAQQHEFAGHCGVLRVWGRKTAIVSPSRRLPSFGAAHSAGRLVAGATVLPRNGGTARYPHRNNNPFFRWSLHRCSGHVILEP
ncbi:MAG: hypothetical protein ACN6O2_15775, partial [Stenotrophomonas sp.]